MKDLIIGDIHGKKNNINKLEIVFKECMKIIKDNDINRTIFLGDLFHEKSVIRTEIANIYLKYFKNWPNELILLVGNHDYTNSTECKIHALEIFKDINNIKIIDDITFDKNSNTVYVPYKQNEYIINWLNNNKETKDCILYGHNGVDGCMYSSGSFEESPIKKHHFLNFKKVFIGHIHKQQSFDNIVIVGSPFTSDYGEANEQKRIIIYDHTINEYNDIYLPIPMHRIFEYNIKSLKSLSKINKELKNILSDNIKLKICAPKNVAKKIFLESFEVPIDSLKIELDEEQIDDKKIISELLTTEEMSEEYLRCLDIEFNLDDMLSLNKEILKEANNDK